MADESDIALASRVARLAGERLVALRQHLTERGADPHEIMDTGDRVASELISEALSSARPDDAILDEEAVDDGRRFVTDRVWIVDPLDGTRQYGERGRNDWAVHIALWERGRFLAASVGLPAIGRVFDTTTASIPSLERERPRMVTSRSRAPYSAHLVASALDADAFSLGSAGAKAMAVVLGDADIYVHDGGMHQWDSAAPVGVAQASGLHTSRIDGSPLVYNQASSWLPDLLICRPEWAAPTLAAIRPHLQTPL